MALFDDVFTNILWNGEVAGSSPDAEGDYYLVTDAQVDRNYNEAKLWDTLMAMSSAPSEIGAILFGGVVSDGGTGTINISEGVALAYDEAGNKRIVHIPALTGVALPSGWNNDRQIWVTAKYDFKLGSATRAHRAVGTSYHYQLNDTYMGDSSGYVSTGTADLFTDADPTATDVVLGSFKMNGTTYADQSVRATVFGVENFGGDVLYVDAIESRTSGSLFEIEGANITGSKFQVTWTSAQLVGSGLSISGIGAPAIASLNGTDVAFIDAALDELRCYRFNGSTWSLVGSGLSISGISYPALASLNGTDVAFIDTALHELRTYRFNGSTWSLVGSGLSISGIGSYPALASLNGADVAFIDADLESLRTYRFNGSTWSLVGSGLSISGIGIPALASLNGADVAFIDADLESLRTYRFNGSTWSLVGSGLSISGIGIPALASLNGADVAFIDADLESLRTYRFNGSTWSLVGSGLSISGIGAPAIASLNGTDVAFIDADLESLRTYRFGFSIS